MLAPRPVDLRWAHFAWYRPDAPRAQGSAGHLKGRAHLVVTKPGRLARSLRDPKDLVDERTRHGVKLGIGGSVHDPTDSVGRLLCRGWPVFQRACVEPSDLF